MLWALREANVSFERIARPPWELRAEKSYLRLNPKGTVPTAVFSFDDARGDVVLNESNTIVSYVAHRLSADLYPSNPETLARAWQWMEWAESSASSKVSPIFLGLVRGVGYPPTPGSKASIERDGAGILTHVNGASVRKCLDVWETLEHELGSSEQVGKYMQGDALTMADIPLGVLAARMFSMPQEELGWDPAKAFPSTRKWYERLMQREAYRECVLPCAQPPRRPSA